MALVVLKPSGYVKIWFPGSPGSKKEGCTGLRLRFDEGTEPTMNDDASLMSIQAPSKATLLCQDVISLIHHCPAPLLSQSGKTV